MQRSKKSKKKERKIDKTLKTNPLALDILKMRYSVRCEIHKKKKRTKNKETIPLKESLEMFYILRVALKRRCKDAFFFFPQQLPVAFARTTFLFFFPPSN